MIVAAAILRDGNIWTLPAPARHHNILWAMHDVDNQTTPDKRPTETPQRGVQGFVDHDGKFLGRKEAAIHARECTQIGGQKKTHPQDQLFSEDLW